MRCVPDPCKFVIADDASDHFPGVNEYGPQPMPEAHRLREEDLA